MAKFRNGWKEVKTLRKYVNGKPTNETKTNESTDPDYIQPYASSACPVNPLPAGVPEQAPPTTTPLVPRNPKKVDTTSKDHTVTFSEYVQGWTSFHSWVPDYMANMNGDFYTFKNGQLYKHHNDQANRNTFYGEEFASELEFVSNEAHGEVKIFKTLELEGDTKDWDVTILTDIDKGHIDKSSFEKKEGFFYSYIRRDSEDIVNTELLSVQGIGMLIGVANNVHTYTAVPSEISVGDILYKATSGSYEKIGKITAITGNTVTTSASAVTPTVNDFMFAAKEPIAESYGLKGYFAKIRISNTSTSKVEVFSVNSETAKSFP